MRTRYIHVGDPLACAGWLSHAERLARGFARRAGVSEVHALPDGGSIRLKKYGFGIKCWIDAGGEPLLYQFYGSEGQMLKTVEDPGNAGRYMPLGNWTLVRLTPLADGTVKFSAKPMVSSLRAAPNGEWAFDANPYDPHPRLAIKPAHQPDGAGVSVWRDVKRPVSWLGTTWAESGVDFAAYRLSGAGPQLLRVSDAGFDYAPTLYRKRAGKQQTPDSDWYRGACLHTAESPTFGTRTFLVSVDVAHRFWCWPLGVSGARLSPDPANKANVPVQFAKSAAAPFPAWVLATDIGRNSALTAAQQFSTPQPKWAFSPSGTKAAIVHIQRDAAWSDTYFTSSRHTEAGVKAWDIKEDWPGVVEVGFSVSVTGPAPEDFTFSVSLLQNMHSKTDGRGYLAAGYAGQDFPALSGGVLYDDLLILEHRYFVGEFARPASDYDDPAQGVAVATADAKVLLHPPLAVVAAITKNGVDVLKWLSAYVARWGRFDGFTADSRFTPTFDHLSDKPADSAKVQMQAIQTAVHSLDFATLTVCLGTSITLTGLCTSGVAAPDAQTLVQWAGPFCASAGMVSLYSLGNLEERKIVGHPQLKSVLPAYFDLTHTRPDFSALTPLTLKATFDQLATFPAVGSTLYNDIFNAPKYRPWPFPSADDSELTRHQFVNLTFKSGVPNAAPQTSSVLHAQIFAHWHANAADEMGVPNLYANGLRDNPLFPSPYFVTTPMIYTLFDAAWHVRPAIRWVRAVQPGGIVEPERSGGQIVVQPGVSSFTGYPVGVLLHARFAASTLHALNNPYTRTSAHPNGSYAIFVGPFAAPSGTVATHPNIGDPQPVLPASVLAGIEQDVLDVIRVRWTVAGNTKDARTSHREMMNEAFGLALPADAYRFPFSVSSGLLRMTPPTSAPAPLPSWRVHHPSEYDLQWWGSTPYGGAAIFGPVCQGWIKQVYINSSGGATMPVALHSFNEVDLFNCPTPATIALPTPRMEGLFSPLPFEMPA